MPELEVDYLYWGSWNNELAWASLILPFPTGNLAKRENYFLVSDYRSGVRGEAIVGLFDDCIGVTGRYYFVKYHDSAREVNPGGGQFRIPGSLSNLSGSSGRVKQDLPYHSADFFMGWGVYGDGRLRLAVQAGGSFAFAKQTVKIELFDPTGASIRGAHGRNRFSGAGPRIGLDGKCVLGGLSFLGELAVAALIGEQTNVWIQNLFLNPSDDTTLQTGTGVVANVQMRFGAKVHRVIGCACTALSVGWEQRNYYNLTSPLSGLTDDPNADGSVIDRFVSDIAFGGPYLGISASF